MKDIVTVREAANFLKKHPDTVRNWINIKKLPARKLSAGKNGIYVLLRSDILEVMVTESFRKKAQEMKKKKLSVPHSPRQVQLPL